MTKEVKDAPVVDAPEQQEPPVPAMPSAGSPPESSAQKGPDVSALIEAEVERRISALDSTLDDKVDARFKSGKDKRLAKVEEIYNWVKEAGGDVDKIKTSLELSDMREQLASIQSGPVGAVGAAAQTDSKWTVAQAKTDIILKSAGIAPDDSEYNLLVEQYQGKVSSEAWPDVVSTFAKNRRGGSPASVIAETGGNAPIPADQEAIAERLMAATRKGDYENVEKLRKELEEAMKS